MTVVNRARTCRTAALGLALLVTGCAAQAQPTSLPSAPSAKPAPDVSAETSSAPARTPVAAGASEGAEDATSSSGSTGAPKIETKGNAEPQVEAVVRAYFAGIGSAAVSGDIQALETIVSSRCPCRQVIETIKEQQRQHHQVSGMVWSADYVRVHDVQGNTAAAEASFVVSAHRITDSAGRLVEDAKPIRAHYDFGLLRTPNGWQLVDAFDLGQQ